MKRRPIITKFCGDKNCQFAKYCLRFDPKCTDDLGCSERSEFIPKKIGR